MRRLRPSSPGVLALLGILAIGAAACGSPPVLASHRPSRPSVITARPGHRIESRPESRLSHSPSPSPSPAPGVDLSSAASVASAEVAATWTVDTATDAGWYAGELAASAYMTPGYAASIRDHPPLGGPGATWSAWATHQATTTVTTTVEDDPGSPADTPRSAYEKVVAVVTPRGSDGWVGAPETWVTYVVLSRNGPGAPWQVSTTETAP